jgi:predicted PurR-regulated permease PerM
VLPAEVLEEMPLPSDRKVTFLGGLFVLALLAAAYVASEIVLPLVFAITLKLLLQPALRAVVCAAVTKSSTGAAAICSRGGVKSSQW